MSCLPAESRGGVRLAVVEAGGEPEGTGERRPRVPQDRMQEARRLPDSPFARFVLGQ